MKTVYFTFLLCFVVVSSLAQASNKTTPDIDNPVVGLLGASFVDPEASPFNHVGLTSLNGSSYRGISDYMKSLSIHNPRGVVYREQAEGGATTNGQNGFLSLLEQATRMVEHTTMWADRTHLKVAVIFRFNDCLHTIAGLCDEQQVLDTTVANMAETIQYLQSHGVKVFVTTSIDYNNMDLPLIERTFADLVPGFKVATREQYELYIDVFEAEIAKMPEVTKIDVWEGMTHIGDGLHPDHRSKMRAAKRLHRAIKKHLKAQ